jgi:hypothetical protein
MSKLMMLFIFVMSGALYDPPRFLTHISDAQAIGWKIKSTFVR